MPEGRRFLLLWAVVVATGALAVSTLGRFGLHVFAVGLLYSCLATAWSLFRATGLFSLGHAAFFGVGALMQASLVTMGNVSPWLALAASALAGAAFALPLIPALRLEPESFALATLAYAILLKGLAGNVLAPGMEGVLLPATPGFEGAALPLVATLLVLSIALSILYSAFLGSPGGRAATAIRQSPETTLSLGIDLIGERWLPLTLSAAATALSGALYAHLIGSVETAVVFSPTFSVLPLVLGMLGGALHPLGGILGTLALYPLDELILRPAFPQAHMLAYGLALVGLLMFRPEGLLRAMIPRVPAFSTRRRPPQAPFALDVRDLTVRRNGTEVLTHVSFRVEPGEILWVLGANGAGKTSLLLAIAGRLPAAEGAIFFGSSASPRGAAARARRGLGRTFQAPRPFGDWTVRENVAFAGERAGALEDVERLLDELQLAALRDRPACRLSVGEGKRLEVARALALGPGLLLLDEPLAGLAPEAQERVASVIERARRESVAILWVEHGPATRALASRVLVLDAGRILFQGSLADWEAARRAPAS